MQILFNQFSNNLIKQSLYNVIIKKNLFLDKSLFIFNDSIFGDNNGTDQVRLNNIVTSNLMCNNKLIINNLLKIVTQITIDILKVETIHTFETTNEIKFLQNKLKLSQSIQEDLESGIRLHRNEDLDPLTEEYIAFVWNNGEKCFTQKDHDGVLQRIYFDSILLNEFFILKDGAVLTGHLTLTTVTVIENIHEQITKQFVDNVIQQIISINHNNMYIPVTGIGMENTTMYFEGREKEVQMYGPLVTSLQPNSEYHQVNVSYYLNRLNVVTSHKHNVLYSLRRGDTTNPHEPIKYDYFTLGKEQETPDELLTLSNLSILSEQHEHPYLWNTTGITDSGEEFIDVWHTTFMKNVIKQNFRYDGSLTISQLNNNTIDDKDSITRSYIDSKIHIKKNQGRIIVGWYDYRQGPGCSTGLMRGTINMRGWFNYYRQFVNPDITEDKFLVIPIISLTEVQTWNRKFLKTKGQFESDYQGSVGQNSCAINQSKLIPYLGYLSQNRQVFGHYTHPDPTHMYIFEVQVLHSVNPQLPYSIESKKVIGFTMDYSGSMEDSDCIAMQDAIKTFQMQMDSEDSGFLVPFSGELEIDVIPETGFLQGGTPLRDQVPTVRPYSGDTALWDQTLVGLERLNTDETSRKRIMIVFTDGRNNDGSTTLQQCIDYAVENLIIIYTIGIGNVDSSDLEKLAGDTGGKYVYGTQGNLEQLYNEVYSETINVVPNFGVGSFQNYRIHMIGGEMDTMFKYMDSESYDKSYVEL